MWSHIIPDSFSERWLWAVNSLVTKRLVSPSQQRCDAWGLLLHLQHAFVIRIF